MAGIRHRKVSSKQDSQDTTLIQASDWNDTHVLDAVPFSGMTAPTTPADGDFWIEASGVSPSRTITLKVRDGGVTRTVATITF